MGRQLKTKYEILSLETEVQVTVNGKRVRRHHTAKQLLCPDNCDDNGNPKTREQILMELAAENKQWRRDKIEETLNAATTRPPVLKQRAVLP